MSQDQTASAAANPFAAYLARQRPLIEGALAEKCPRPLQDHARAEQADLDRYLYAPLAHFTESGGKRTRPAL